MGKDVINLVYCSEHGQQEETFVCQHIVETLKDKKPRGFFWSSSQNIKRPDAWCYDCNTRVKAMDGEWTEDIEKHANIQLLCGKCYDNAKKLNLDNNLSKSMIARIWNKIVTKIV